MAVRIMMIVPPWTMYLVQEFICIMFHVPFVMYYVHEDLHHLNVNRLLCTVCRVCSSVGGSGTCTFRLAFSFLQHLKAEPTLELRMRVSNYSHPVGKLYIRDQWICHPKEISIEIKLSFHGATHAVVMVAILKFDFPVRFVDQCLGTRTTRAAWGGAQDVGTEGNGSW